MSMSIYLHKHVDSDREARQSPSSIISLDDDEKKNIICGI